MRHRKSGRKLNRSNSHRKAMFRNMARALLTYERIRTTEAKAKELRGVVDSLITLAIRDDLHARRLAYKALNNHQMVQRLFDEIGPRFKEGGGGYTRILKLSMPRKGDCAPMVVIELTRKADDLETAEEIKEDKTKKKAPAKKAAPKKEKAEKAEEVIEEKPKKSATKKVAPKKKATPKKAVAKKAAPKKEKADKAEAKPKKAAKKVTKKDEKKKDD